MAAPLMLPTAVHPDTSAGLVVIFTCLAPGAGDASSQGCRQNDNDAVSRDLTHGASLLAC
jgi:hypothetical protein